MLGKDRNTPYRLGDQLSVSVAAAKKIYAGALVVGNATGFAEGGSTALALTYLGRAEAQVDNSTGADGDVSVNIRRGVAFKFKNAGADLVTQASLMKDCYIVDDETVAATDGTNTRSVAGKVIGIDSDGVWVL